MAQLVLGAVGAVVGNFLLPGIGGSIGFALGSAVGGALFAPTIEGPGIGEKQVQLSSYGQTIPIAYGGVRVAGNMFWAADLVEVEHKSGGKGGPTQVTKTATGSSAIAICEGPIVGIRKVWADAKLVYDISSAANASAQASSAKFADYFVFYTGDEVQLADPTIEAAIGVGNVPGYHGTCYIVFTDLPLEDYGNRWPSFTFEITNQAAVASTTGDIQPEAIPAWIFDTGGKPVAADSGAMEFVVTSPSEGAPPTFTSFAAALAHAQAIASPSSGTGSPEANVFVGYHTGTQSALNLFSGGATLGDDPEYVYYHYAYERPAIVSESNIAGYLICTNAAAIGATVDDGISYLTRESYAATLSGLFKIATSAPSGYLNVNSCVLSPPLTAGNAYVSRFNVIRGRRVASCPASTCQAGDPCTDGIAQLPDDAGFCITCDGTLSVNSTYTDTAGTYKQLRADTWTGSGFARSLTSPALGPVLASTDPSYSDQAYWDAAAVDAGVSGTYGVDYPVIVATACVANGTALQAAAGSAILSDIVADISDRSGLVAGSRDVTALTDTVLGYVIPHQMPGRSAIEPLRQGFYFDGVERATKVVFVKRGAASAGTFAATDLGAGAERPQETLLDHVRAQETDLPARVNVSYLARTRDYETGTQSARRMTTGSQQVQGVDLAIVMTELKAAQVADVLMYDAWTARNQRTFATTRKFTKWEPTDVITVNDGTFDYVVRVIDKAEDGGLVKFQAVDENPAAYSPNVVVATGTSGTGTGGTDSTVRFDGPTVLVLLDIPIVRDSDTAIGMYVAVTGYRSTWPGCVLYGSADGGATYTALKTITEPSTIGYATTALGAYYDGNTIDELNTVTVTTTGGATLSSVTADQLLAGGNLAVIGNELVGFRTATLTATNTYRLSGLLRGRRGTEWAISGHVANDRFVLLPVTAIAFPPADLNLPRLYKAVTMGDTLANTTALSFTVRGAAWRPYAPVLLGGGNVAGDVTLNWTRRTRLGGAFVDGSDVPLSESSEAYVVQIWNATYTLCARIISTTAQTTIYTAAMQTTDFGANQQTIYFTVGEVGAYGLGDQAAGTAPGAGGSNTAPSSPVTPYTIPPPSAGGSGVCPSPVTNDTATNGTRIYNAGFAVGETWVVKFNTGSASRGLISISEYASGPTMRHATMATSPCGLPVGPGAKRDGVGITLYFWITGNPSPGIYPTLAASTDYYVSYTTDASSGAAVVLSLS